MFYLSAGTTALASELAFEVCSGDERPVAGLRDLRTGVAEVVPDKGPFIVDTNGPVNVGTKGPVFT